MGKRQPLNPVNQNTPLEPPEFRSVKMEKSNRVNNLNRNDRFQEPIPKRRRSDRPHPVATLTGGGGGGSGEEPPRQDKATDVRVLRSNYQAVKTLINEEKEEICKGESDRFQKIMGEVNRLHEHVTMPREQVTDAETLLDMADTLVTCVRAHSKEGFTPADFVSCLLREFGTHDSIKWNAVGVLVCPIFQNGGGCCTMIGPMNSQLKQRKVTAPRKRTKLTGSAARPEQLEHSGDDEKTDTDKNMATMFNILRKEKAVKLENLILNRFSFAQTVENLFALSFLAKDGRVQITADKNGSHTVSPRNAPNADVVATGDVVYNHFVFRFDFQDWKLMTDTVSGGEELMPHRYQVSIPMSQADILCNDSVLTAAAIPTAKVSANPGSGLQ